MNDCARRALARLVALQAPGSAGERFEQVDAMELPVEVLLRMLVRGPSCAADDERAAMLREHGRLRLAAWRARRKAANL